MSKFAGCIGFSLQAEETDPGVYVDNIVERSYRGDVLRQANRFIGTEVMNSTVTVQHRISVIADDFANSNYAAIRYVKWGEAYWKVSAIEIEKPRLIVTLSEVYNGIKA